MNIKLIPKYAYMLHLFNEPTEQHHSCQANLYAFAVPRKLKTQTMLIKAISFFHSFIHYVHDDLISVSFYFILFYAFF